MKTEQPIYHVAFHGNGSHFYFGSIAAIFELFNKEHIGCGYDYLRGYGIKPGNPYVNKKCVIRVGNLYRKAGGRGRR